MIQFIKMLLRLPLRLHGLARPGSGKKGSAGVWQSDHLPFLYL